MPVSIVQSISVADACQAIPLLPSLLAWRQAHLTADQGVALVMPNDELPCGLGVDAEMLLLVVPDDLASLLPDVAAANFFDYNRDSDDLLSRQTLMALTTTSTWVEVDAWAISFCPSVEVGRFYVGLVASDRFMLALHDYGSEDMDAFLGGLQGACDSSGPNYRPWRYWSEEELEAAARGERPPSTPCWTEPSRRVQCHAVLPS